jgi:SAM-dependent methyltransferase
MANIGISREDDPAVKSLRERLDVFYANVSDYTAFQQPSAQFVFWEPIRRGIEERLARTGSCRVLEFGAGRSGFSGWLPDALRRSIHLAAQDVTSKNIGFLKEVCDSVHIGPVQDISQPFDIAFSTFVWEHVTDPRATLNFLLKLVSPGGSVFIACPRYEFPFYISPSASHYGRFDKLGLALWLIGRRVCSRIIRKADFLIHTDPAVLNGGPWRRDTDAIHWPSLFDLQVECGERAQVRKLSLPYRGIGKQWFWSRFLLLFAEIKVTCDREDTAFGR